MAAHPNRCKRCKFAPGETGRHWCYAKPPANGGYRQWIDQSMYDNFIALLGCASFQELPEDEIWVRGRKSGETNHGNE